jgi:hypothetical protein
VSAITKAVEFFPLLRGRTGIEVLTRKMPVLFRFHRNNGIVETYRKKVKCRLVGDVLMIATKNVSIQTAIFGYVTKITIAIDCPLLDTFEADVLGFKGANFQGDEIDITPVDGCLLSITRESFST